MKAFSKWFIRGKSPLATTLDEQHMLGSPHEVCHLLISNRKDGERPPLLDSAAMLGRWILEQYQEEGRSEHAGRRHEYP